MTTLAEIQNLSDDEINERIAVLMGWTRVMSDDGQFTGIVPSGVYPSIHNKKDAPDYLGDWRRTMEVVERMEADGWQFWMTSFASDVTGLKLTRAIFGKAGTDDAAYENLDRRRAICLAALLAATDSGTSSSPSPV